MSDYLEGLERLSIDREDIVEAKEALSKPLKDPIVVLGCPHATLNEIFEISQRVKGRKMEGKLWVFTSRGVYHKAEMAGYMKTIEEAGGRVYRDTCMVVAPLKEMGWSEVATNSFKAAHYMASMGLETRIDTIKGLLEG
jgi:predicted aconitase